MTAKSRILTTTTIEREIGERARAAKLKLRFDRLVRRLTGDLKATLAGVLPEGQSVLITVTAPIKHPAKTADAREYRARRPGSRRALQNDSRQQGQGPANNLCRDEHA